MIRELIVPAGTTLFHVAGKYLGDATKWIRIATLNGMEDPFLSETTIIKIPLDSGSGG